MIETKSLILDGPQVFFRIVLLERLTGIGYSSSACCVSLSVVFRGGCRAQCWLICGDNSGCLVVEECRSMCQQRIDVVNSVGKLLLPGLLLARACARQKEGAPVYQYGLQPLKFKLRRVHFLNDQPHLLSSTMPVHQHTPPGIRAVSLRNLVSAPRKNHHRTKTYGPSKHSSQPAFPRAQYRRSTALALSGELEPSVRPCSSSRRSIQTRVLC